MRRAIFLPALGLAAVVLAAGAASAQSAGSLAELLGKTIDWANTGIEVYDSASEAIEAYGELSPDDAAYRPDYDPAGMPEVPISCGEDAACQTCYERAHHNLNFVRQQFERLRAVYQSTKTYADKMVAFGDTTSGIHGVMGLAWQYEKAGILESVEKLGKTYDGKHRDLLASLEKSLKQIATCEAEHFGVGDWYSRWGFMYYTFMADRYRRDE